MSRRIVSITAISWMLTVALVAPAHASDTVDFEGSGWGHGVGLSQYGALAMARDGHTYQSILTHYYQGTSISTVPASTTLWVNLERDFASLTLTVAPTGSGSGSDVVITGDGGSASAAPGSTISIISQPNNGCQVNVSGPGENVSLEDPTDCSFDFSWYDWTDSAAYPPTKVTIGGCTLADWNAAGGTAQVPCQYARGMLHLRSGAGGLDLSAEMLLDDYVLGISEMPYSWDLEALKAQAVAARSYAEARRIVRGDPATNSCGAWCHVKDTTSDQRYVGWGHSNVGNWITASNSTASQVVTHPASSIGVVTTYYSSSSGGATEYGHEKGFSSGPVEWLSSVDDSWAVDGSVYNPKAAWTTSVPISTVKQALGLDSITAVEVIERRPGSGSAKTLRFSGLVDGVATAIEKTASWVRLTFGLYSEYIDVDFSFVGDEMLFYDSNGTFRYNWTGDSGELGPVINSGNGYTTGWKSIASIDLDGDGQDEIFFYRNDGLFRFYEIDANANIGSPILAGSGYTAGWDSISAVDLDGDGQDEMFFYRSDGLYRYYNIKPNGEIGSPILAGSGYTAGWDSISAVDLDGDGQDEMFFYRDDGLYRYYDIKPNGEIGSPIRAGSGYSSGWDSITAVDLDGDGQDEMFFYRDDGLYRYYNISATGKLGAPIAAGSNYAQGWDVITAINLDGG